jgi:anti-anti-sigma factor
MMISDGKAEQMRTDLKLEANQVGDVRVLAIQGHVDAHTAPLMEDGIASLLEEGISRVVLDLADLTYISSAGLGVLTGTLGTFRERGGDLKLARTPEKVFRVLDLLGFTRLMTLYDSPEEAIGAFQAGATVGS